LGGARGGVCFYINTKELLCNTFLFGFIINIILVEKLSRFKFEQNNYGKDLDM
jgi:hypothetical protein